jgi:hypothetical protein
MNAKRNLHHARQAVWQENDLGVCEKFLASRFVTLNKSMVHLDRNSQLKWKNFSQSDQWDPGMEVLVPSGSTLL